jgi:hypothetical protein
MGCGNMSFKLTKNNNKIKKVKYRLDTTGICFCICTSGRAFVCKLNCITKQAGGWFLHEQNFGYISNLIMGNKKEKRE